MNININSVTFYYKGKCIEITDTPLSLKMELLNEVIAIQLENLNIGS